MSRLKTYKGFESAVFMSSLRLIYPPITITYNCNYIIAKII